MQSYVFLFFFLLVTPLLFAQDNCPCLEGKNQLAEITRQYGDDKLDSAVIGMNKLKSLKSRNCQYWYLIWQNRIWLKTKGFEKAKKSLDSLNRQGLPKCGDVQAYYHFTYSEYFFKLNLFDSAWVQAVKSLDLAEKIGDKEIQVRSLNITALVLNRLDQPEKAMVYRKRAVEMAKKSGDLRLVAAMLTNLAADYGRTYDLTEDLEYIDSAKVALTEALVISRKSGDLSILLQGFKIMAGIYIVEKNYPMAIVYADSTIREGQPGPHDLHLASAYYKKSDAYIELKQLDKARAAADSAKKYALASGSANMLKASLERVYETSKLMGDYVAALEAFESITLITDSITGAENTSIITELEQKYNKAENEKTISELNQKKQIDGLRIRFLIAGVAISVLIIILIGFFYRQSILKNKQQILEAEQRLNRARMDPHFFFNALTSIQTSLLEGKEPQKTASYLSRFAKMMRQTLESTYNDLIPIEEEVEFLTNYLELQKGRHPEKFEYEISIDGNIDPSEVYVPSMILQPFVENVIEHAFKGIDYRGSIVVSFAKEANGISISIEDNGIGAHAKPGASKKGAHVSRAMQIIEDRLFILNKTTQKKASFEVSNGENGNGTKVMVNLPML